MELYPRKCLITGNGFNKGFKVGDVYIELKKHVNPYCKVHYKMTFQKLYEEGQEEFSEVDSDFAYFSEWDDDDILEQGFGYDENGNIVYVSEDNVQTLGVNYLKIQMKHIEEGIDKRAEEEEFSGDDEDLYSYEMDHKDFEFWSREAFENHAYDLGAYWNLKRVLEHLQDIELLKKHSKEEG